MIISASRRTDVPAFFSKWLERRLDEGFVLVRNPFNFHQVSRVRLDPAVVDGIVLWTKNPGPMLSRIHMMEKYPWYMQFTINPYGPAVEKRLPDEESRIDTFHKLSQDFGSNRLVWRYDPIFFSDSHTVSWHVESFGRLARQLAGMTDTVCTSFMHMYAKTRRNTASLGLRPGEPSEQLDLLGKWQEIATQTGMRLHLCATPEIQRISGTPFARCVDAERLSRISGIAIRCSEDRGQRKDCHCAPSIDIGAYDTCGHGCAYCYANATDSRALSGLGLHDPASALLVGQLMPTDTVTERHMCSFAATSRQLSMLD